MKKQRDSNIELLRIFAILLIIVFHYVYKSGFLYTEFNTHVFLVKLLYFCGELGVNLFVLITGYFTSKGKFSLKKLILLLLEVEFYSLFSTFIAIKLGILTISGRKQLFQLFFPTILNKYWFTTAYILLYIISPYLNILIENLNKKAFQKMLLIVLILWSIIPTIFGAFYNTTELLLYYSRFVWLIIVYLIGAYIRIYNIKILDKKRNSIFISIITFILMALSILIINKYSIFFNKVGIQEVSYFWYPNSILMVILSISVFMLFLKIKIKSSKVINCLASTTLGIYLLHDGDLGYYMWWQIFKTPEKILQNDFFIHLLIAVSIIFIVGVIVDLIRQFLETHIIKRILDSKLYAKIIEKINIVFNKLSEYF